MINIILGLGIIDPFHEWRFYLLFFYATASREIVFAKFLSFSLIFVVVYKFYEIFNYSHSALGKLLGSSSPPSS